MAHAFRWYRLSIFLALGGCFVVWTETHGGDVDENYEVGRTRLEVMSLCPDAKLHENVSK
jgi:hypothetical protein